MATVNFLVKGKGDAASIYIRFRHGASTDLTRNTGYVINPNSWNKTKKAPYPRTPELKSLKNSLLQLEIEVYNSFNQTSINYLSNEWLESIINEHRGIKLPSDKSDENLLTNAIQRMIESSDFRENAKGGLGLSKSRIDSYRTLKRLVIEYQGSKKIDVLDVDVKFAEMWLRWMIQEKNYAQSYARKRLDDIKTVCRNAAMEGFEVSPQLNLIKGGKFKNEHIIYLSPSELKLIEELHLISQPLINAKKWLLLGCMVGQRVSDLLSLKAENFVTRDGLELIELTQQKTGKKVTIPLLDDAVSILEDGLPYPISSQKFNYYIKEICRLAGINNPIFGSKYDNITQRKISGTYPKYELISSHVCRRSFATNLYGEMPTALIMQITGHSTEKMLLRYIGKGTMDYAQQINDFFDKQKIRKAERTNLRIVGKTVNS